VEKMREIKFRAFIDDCEVEDENGKEYKFSFYLKDVAVYSNLSFIGISADDFSRQTSNMNIPEDLLDRFQGDFINDHCYEDEWLNIDCFKALEQYTGLKDKNGKAIYEGDIVEIKDEEISDIAPVVWSADWAAFQIDDNTFHGISPKHCSRNCEVLGNIHENPELLEGAKCAK
jgi:hypothetical protein